MTEKKPSFLRTILDYSLPLIFGVITALVFANVAPDAYGALLHWSPLGPDHALAHYFNLHFLVNDVFMAFFFGLAAKEIVEAAMPGGALNPIKKAINPLLGTIGGVLGPVGVYFLYVFLTGNQDIARGWGIPTATDIALAWLVARVVFGVGHPAVSFLLLLAVADDAIGLGIIAIFYPDPEHPVEPAYIAVVAAAMAIAYGLRRARVTSFWPYVLVPGVISWVGLFLAHLHPALALVAIVPFMPNGGHDAGVYVERHQEEAAGVDTLNQFEHFFKIPVDLGLFFFGLANAGVQFAAVGDATWAVLLALVVGKTVGISAMSFVGHKLGFSLPDGMGYRELVSAGVVAAMGLTVALFVAGVAFTDPTIQSAAKMGALFSAFVAPLAIVVGRVLRVRRTGS